MTKWRRLAWEPAIISHDWHGWRWEGLYWSHLAGGPRECPRCRGPSRSMCIGCPDTRCHPPRRDTGPGPVSILSQRDRDRGKWSGCCCHGTKPSSHGCLSAYCKMVWSPFLCWITEMSWCLFVHLNTLHGNRRKNCQCEKLLDSLLSKCLFFWYLYPLLPVVSPQLTVGISWATVNSPTGRGGTKPGPGYACAGRNAPSRARWGSGHHLTRVRITYPGLMAIWCN